MSAPAATEVAAAASAEEAVALEALLVSRAYLYALFHKLLGGRPNAELLDELLGSDMADVVDEYAADDETMAGLGRFLSRLAAREDRAELLDEARDEHMRLFVGPAALPALPWESPYRTKEPSVFQESTLAVRRAYRARGLEPKRIQRVPDDHVALLCAFMEAQASSALAAFRAGDMEGLCDLLRDQQAFAAEHLAGWLPSYARDVRRSKTAVLYPQMIEALAAFVALDVAFAGEGALWAASNAGASLAAPGSPEAAAFSRVDAAREGLAELRLQGIEENELVSIGR